MANKPLVSPVTAGNSLRHFRQGKPYAVCSAKGWRKFNEDRFNAFMNLRKSPPHSFFAIYDGHGGSKAAEYCANHLYRLITEDVAWPDQPLEAMRAGVVKCDRAYQDGIKEWDREKLTGTTALMALVMGSQLLLGWVGDSRAVMLRNKSGAVVQLTQDHKPNVQAERERIEQRGGRVVDGRVNGVLSTSRSIGVAPMSDVVVAQADTKGFAVADTDDIIVMASDGEWRFVCALHASRW